MKGKVCDAIEIAGGILILAGAAALLFFRAHLVAVILCVVGGIVIFPGAPLLAYPATRLIQTLIDWRKK